MNFPAPHQSANESPPEQGNYLALWMHHDGESHYASKAQILERIRIIRTKPKDEIQPRLKRMTIIPYSTTSDKAWKEYIAIRAKAWKEYDAICSKAWKEYDAICSKARKECDAIRDKTWKECKRQIIQSNATTGLHFKDEQQ